MSLSRHFLRIEFTCHCGCGFDTVDAELIRVLETARANLRSGGIIVLSGSRCKQHNKDVGGAENSQHIAGKAADIIAIGVDPDTVADYFEDRYPNKYGIGRYDNFTHIDVRSDKARWIG